MLKFVNVPVELVALPAVSALRFAFVDCVPCGVALTVTQSPTRTPVGSPGFVLPARNRR